MDIRLPDEEFEKPFRAYSNYLEELAGVIGGQYGLEESLVLGIQSGMRAHLPLRRVQKRRLNRRGAGELERALQKSWSFVRRVGREVDEDEYDEEANAWLPEQAYYAVHHAMQAVVTATRGDAPREHRPVLNAISREVTGGRLVFPWSAYCEGCPQLDTEWFTGLAATQDINVLRRPDPQIAEERIALLLKTTREKGLERRFDDARHKQVRPGHSRRNLSRAEKIKRGEKLSSTTLFGFFYRTRKKAHYEEPDVFVLGAAGPPDARRFGESMAIVTDATVAALECLVATYVGKGAVGRAALKYADRISAEPDTLVGRRSSAWADLVPAAID